MRPNIFIPSPYCYWMVVRSLMLLAYFSIPGSIVTGVAIDRWWPFLVSVVVVPLILNPATKWNWRDTSFSLVVNMGVSNNTIWDHIARRLGLRECPDCRRIIFSLYPDGDFNSATLVPYYGSETEPLEKGRTLGFWPQPICVECGYDFTVRRQEFKPNESAHVRD